jgi:SAM-dependent methyltransferase
MGSVAVSSRTPSQRKMWDAWHTRHRAENGWTNADGPLAEEFTAALPSGHARVLDLGCGQCTSALYATERRRLSIVATDFSARALARASKRLDRGDVALQKLDIAKRLPYEDDAFDGVYAHLSLQYFSARRTVAIFDEVARVCAPGGVFALAVKSVEDPRFERGERIEHNMYCLKGHVRHFFSIDEVAELLCDWTIQDLCEVQAYDPDASFPSSIISALARKH